MVWFKSDSGSSQVTRPSQLNAPNRLGRGRCVWAVGFRSHGPPQRTLSRGRLNLSPWIKIGRRPCRRPPPVSLARSLSGPWQGVGEAASGRVGAVFNGPLWCALIAHRASSPGSPHSTNSRRPRRSLDRSEHPRHPPVALGHPFYLSPGAASLSFLCSPSSSSPHLWFLCKPLALKLLLPPLPPSGVSVKAVVQCSSLSNSSSLSPLWSR